MRGLTTLGAVLIVLSVAALLFGHFHYTETKPVLDAGPIQVNTQEDRTIWIPTIAGIAVLAAGAGLLVAARKS